MTKKITFYADIVSPFAYMGYWMLRNSPIFKSCEVTYVPILLGGVMKECGNTPPINIKNKDKWINTERIRWATQFQIPIRPGAPSGFPISTVAAGRLLAAVELQSPENLPKALDALFNAVWGPQEGSDLDMKNPEVLTSILSPDSILGPELTQSVVSAMTSNEVKSQLMKNTSQAVADGAFGLPWFRCTNDKGEVEGFWGFDHMGQVVRFLGLGEESLRKLQPML